MMQIRTRVGAAAGAMLLLAGCSTGQGQVTPTAPGGVTPTISGSVPVPGDAAGFQAFVATFRAEAAARGVPETVLATAFDSVTFQPEVIANDQEQPEFNRAIWDYLDRAVSEKRVADGQAMLAEWGQTANRVQERYGVPKEIVVAIWGLESNYGQNFGSFEIIDALSTLAYEGRRRDFARGELFSALKILEAGDISRDRMLGSWAGAMGHTQFIPSSFLAHAVDFDGDGRRDIWGSIPDVMASTANYLAEKGWTRGQVWGLEVTLPQGFDYAQADMSVTRSADSWAAIGVKPASGRNLPGFAEASIIVPAGARGPAFMVGPNFRTIMRYNNSTSYALAVAHLSDRLAGGGPIVAAWPRDEQPLTRSQVMEMQTLLNARGFPAGEPDGLTGPTTRAGIRAYQKSLGLIPDGFATLALLQRLQGG